MQGDREKDGVQLAAREALAALKAYSQHVDSLVHSGWDAHRYGEAAELFERMRLCSALLRELQVHWIELLVTRFEVAHALWEARHATGTTEQLKAAHERHVAAIGRYRQTCSVLYLQEGR